MSYLLDDWKELVPEANCELWKAYDLLIVEPSTNVQPEILDISNVREKLMKKCKKHGPHT